MADPWDWQDDSFKLDAAESPLEITRCLWDELPHSVEDTGSLFSTPLPDISAQDPPPFYSIRAQDPEIFAPNRFCSTGLQGGGGGSPRMKRRRLLFCEQPDPVFTHDPHAESDSVIASFTNCMDPLMQVCSSGLQQQSIDVLPSDSFWFRHCDDLPAPFAAGEEAVEHESHNWMTKSLEDGEDHGSNENDSMKITLPGWSGGHQQPVSLLEEDLIQGPATPLPGRPTLYSSRFRSSSLTSNSALPNRARPCSLLCCRDGSSVDATTTTSAGSETRKHQQQRSPPSTPYSNLSTPVAYPFTLLKPSETDGDITLKDINQRILMPSSRPLPHLPHQRNHQQQGLMDESSSWPSNGCCSPPPDPGLLLGLSGKSIVTRTKIHTEGNGTITIMRTRG